MCKLTVTTQKTNCNSDSLLCTGRLIRPRVTYQRLLSVKEFYFWFPQKKQLNKCASVWYFKTILCEIVLYLKQKTLQIFWLYMLKLSPFKIKYITNHYYIYILRQMYAVLFLKNSMVIWELCTLLLLILNIYIDTGRCRTIPIF